MRGVPDDADSERERLARRRSLAELLDRTAAAVSEPMTFAAAREAVVAERPAE